MSSLFLLFLSTSVSAPLWVLRELFPCRSFMSFTDAVDLLFQLSVSPLSASCSSLGLPSSAITSSTQLSVFSHDLPRLPHPSYAFQCAIDAVWSYFNSLFLSFSVFKTLLFFHSFFLFHRCLSFHGNPLFLVEAAFLPLSLFKWKCPFCYDCCTVLNNVTMIKKIVKLSGNCLKECCKYCISLNNFKGKCMNDFSLVIVKIFESCAQYDL